MHLLGEDGITDAAMRAAHWLICLPAFFDLAKKFKKAMASTIISKNAKTTIKKLKMTFDHMF
jgi:hypothetical protein